LLARRKCLLQRIATNRDVKWERLANAFDVYVTDKYVGSVLDLSRHTRGYALLSPNYFNQRHNGHVARLHWAKTNAIPEGLKVVAVEMFQARTYAVVAGFKDETEIVEFKRAHGEDLTHDIVCDNGVRNYPKRPIMTDSNASPEHSKPDKA
jgi:hypothetical protein